MTKDKQPSGCKFWFMTFNNYTEQDVEQLKIYMDEHSIRYVFQEEVAPSTGTPHLQGKFEFAKKIRWSAFNLNKNIRWFTSKEWKGFEYCFKSVTRPKDGRQWCKGIVIARMVDNVRHKLFKPWHHTLFALLDIDPDDRIVYWVWSKGGGVGKQTFINHIVYEHEDWNMLRVGGRKTDMACGVRANAAPYLVNINLEMECESISYTGIEMIKDAMFFSPKYESDMVKLKFSPHILVTANKPPSRLLNNRIKVYEIIDDELVDSGPDLLRGIS